MSYFLNFSRVASFVLDAANVAPRSFGKRCNVATSTFGDPEVSFRVVYEYRNTNRREAQSFVSSVAQSRVSPRSDRVHTTSSLGNHCSPHYGQDMGTKVCSIPSSVEPVVFKLHYPRILNACRTSDIQYCLPGCSGKHGGGSEGTKTRRKQKPSQRAGTFHRWCLR